MARVIILSRNFPAYHPQKNQPTYFVEKFLKCWESMHTLEEVKYADLIDSKFVDSWHFKNTYPKGHTIRQGERFKVGDYFSPRIWSGKPYQSKQIIIAPDTKIENVYDFEIKVAYKELPLDYDTDIIINHRFYHSDDKIMQQLAQNDGLKLPDLLRWFKYPQPFKGQIICWDPKIKY